VAEDGGRFPAELVEFVNLFNSGRFWDSHEVLETPWRDNRSDFYQGLILYASGWVHADRNNVHGVRAQLAKAERRLRAYHPAYLGLDVAALLSSARQLVDQPQALADSSPPVLVLDPSLVRGNEIELAPD